MTVAGGVLELQPAGGTALRVPSRSIASVAEPEPFIVLVTLADGSALELSRLGRMRTQLLEELRDARAGVAAAESGAMGGAARFTGTVGASPADLHVFEDALLVMAGGRATRVAFSFVADVRARDYTVTIDVTGQGALVVTRLGSRTDEFTALLTERLREARNRTSAFLGSLLPGLDPMALRAAAGLLRDGVAVQARALDAIHPDLSATLLRVATLPDRLAAVSGLADEADLAIGFKQLTSVRRAAVGLTPWQDPSVTPHIGQHETPGGRFGPGLGGVMAAGIMSGAGAGRRPGGYGYGGYGYGGPFGGGPGGFGGYWGVPRARRGDELELRRPAADDPARGRPSWPAHPGNRGPGRADHVRRRPHGPGVRAAVAAARWRPGRLRGPQPAGTRSRTSTARAAPTPAPLSTRHSTTSASPPPKSTPPHQATWRPPAARTPRPPR